MPSPSLSAEQIRRYARHILLPDVGGVGQTRLLGASVTVEVGPDRVDEGVALLYLAAAGVGRVVLCGAPAGAVTEREAAGCIVYGSEDVGRPRAEAIAERVAQINPDVRVDVAGAPGPAGRSVALAGAPGLDAPLGGARPEEEVAAALMRGGVRAVHTLTRLLHNQPDEAEP